MEKNYSVKALSDFLDFAGQKGLVNQTTAQSRKSAFVRIISVLEPNEQQDLRNIDLEETFARFQTKFPQAMTPDSFVTYKSRAKKALEDFLVWIENPSGFKVQHSKKAKTSTNKSPPAIQRHDKSEEESLPHVSISSSGQSSKILIRENVLVQISNLPFDLKKAEADRIKKIIDAHVVS